MYSCVKGGGVGGGIRREAEGRGEEGQERGKE